MLELTLGAADEHTDADAPDGALVRECRQALGGGVVSAGKGWLRAALMSGVNSGSMSETQAACHRGSTERNVAAERLLFLAEPQVFLFWRTPARRSDLMSVPQGHSCHTLALTLAQDFVQVRDLCARTPSPSYR